MFDPNSHVYQLRYSFALTPEFRLLVKKATNLEAASIPEDMIQGPILFISGESDDLFPSTEMP